MPSPLKTQDPKTTEDWLRQELRADRTLMTGLMQWGVGIMAAIQLNLYYIRRDAAKHLVDLKKLQPDQLLPFGRWVCGTLLLVLLAYIFSSYMKRIIVRHVGHRKQLENGASSYSGIEEVAPIGGLKNMHNLLFWAFPAYDLIVYIYFYAGEKLSFSFTLPW